MKRNIKVFVDDTKQTLVFPGCHRNVTDLRWIEFKCYLGCKLDAKVPIKLYWMKNNKISYLCTNEDVDDFWDNCVVNKDGFIELRMWFVLFTLVCSL